MAPAPTDVDDGTRNPEREHEEHPKTGGRSVRGRPAFPAPAAPAAPVPIKGNAAAVTAAAVAVGMLREDTSSVGSRGGPSPSINGSPTSSSVQPPRLEEEDGQEEQPPPAAGPGNLSSGISIEELKKMTALRMANQQQQAHLRVVSPFDYGGPAEEGGRPGRPHSRGPSPNQPPVTHGARDREIGGGSSGVVDGGGSNYRRGSGFPRATPTGEASPASNGPAEEGGVLRVRPDDDDDVPAASAVPPAPSSTCSGHSSRSGGDGGGGSANPKLGGRPVSSKGSNGGGRRKQSPPPAAAPNRGGGGGSGSGSSRASPVSTTSVMAHGLTVQELKELTKIRLAREAFDLPVHSSAAPTASVQQQDSIGGGGGGGGGSSSSGGVPRGRVGSPALSVELGGERRHRRHDSSRSPMHPRSNPSTPGLEDRPHRRTRRGGRRGRNRSPRPDDQYSPRLGDESNHNDGYSSASYSPRPRRSMSDPWADPHDQFPRSSSQPRTVIRDDRDDHPLLSALSKEGASDGYGGGGGGGGARSSHPAGTSGADLEDLGLAGGSRSSGVRGEGSGSLGPGAAAAAAAAAVAATATAAGGGGRGDQLPARAAHPSLSSSQSATFSRGSPDNGASSGGGGAAGRSSPSMGSTAWEQDFHDRRREDGTGAAGGGRGTVVGAGIAEDFQHHHGGGSRGRDRDREARPERGAGAALSGQRPRSLHHLDRRHLGEGERRQFSAEAEQVHLRERGAGGALHVNGMIGNERLTSLRGFRDPRVGPPAHPQHDHRHLDHHHQQQQQQQQQASPYFLRAQRSNSEGLPRPSSQQQHQQQHQRQQHQQQHNYLRVGSSTGSANGNRLPLRAQQDASRMGDRHHSHHYQQQQQQQQQQVHPHRRYASDSSYQHGPPPPQQHHHAASHSGFPGAGAAGGGGSWAGGGSGARYFSPHGGAGGPQLVSRKSDGGGVVISSAAYHPQGGQGVGVGDPTGMAGAGGVRHGSSTSLADGDISYNVAESVLVTPRKDPGGSWKSSSSGSSGSGGSGKNNGVNAQYAVPAPAPSWREYQAGRAQQQQQQRPQVATARQFAADGRSGAEAMGGRVGGRPDYPSHLHGINASSGGASGPRGMGGRFDSSMPSSRRRGSHEENGMMPIMSNHHHGSNSQAGPFALARRSSGSGGIGGGGSGGGSAHASPSLPAHRQSPPMPPSRGLHGFQAGSGGALNNALHRGPPSSSPSLSFSPAFGGMRGDAQPGGGPGLNDNAVGGREGGSDGGVGGRGSPLSGGSPLMAGLSFSLDLAGYNGGAGGAGGRLVGRAGSEGALSAHSKGVDFFPKARDGDTASNGGGGGGGGGGVSASAGAAGAGDGGRGFASGLFGFDTGRGAGGGGMGASPSSHHSAGPMDSSTMPRQLDIGPSSLSGGGGMGPTDPPLLADAGSLFSSFGQGGSGSVGGGGGVDVMSFPGARQTRSASSPSIAVGRERNGSAIAAIGSSRNNSAHSSPSMAGVSGISGNGNGNRNGGTPPSTSSGMGVDANLEFSLLDISRGGGGGGGGSARLDAFGAQKTVQS